MPCFSALLAPLVFGLGAITAAVPAWRFVTPWGWAGLAYPFAASTETGAEPRRRGGREGVRVADEVAQGPPSGDREEEQDEVARHARSREHPGTLARVLGVLGDLGFGQGDLLADQLGEVSRQLADDGAEGVLR